MGRQVCLRRQVDDVQVINGEDFDGQSLGHAEGFTDSIRQTGVFGGFFKGNADHLKPQHLRRNQSRRRKLLRNCFRLRLAEDPR